jgi:outer membrane protein
MMPGRDTAQTKLQAISKTLEDQLKAMQTEYDSKVASYQAEQATMSDLIKQTKGKEIQDLAKRIEDFQTSAQQELQTKESELVQPIIDKAKKAIEAVAKENGYTYILDSAAGSVVLYAEPTDDILPLVKKKLGIK